MAMKMGLGTTILSLLLIFITTSSAQSTCNTYSFSNNQTFSNCVDLPVLDAFLHWTYDTSSGTANIAYRVAANVSPSSNWIAWALNPTGTGMVGAQALVAYQNSSGGLQAHTSNVTSHATTLAISTISFQVRNLTATSETSQMIIFATITPPHTTMNMVWQVGPLNNGLPAAHPTAPDSDHRRSLGPIDFLSSTQTSETPALPPSGNNGGSGPSNNGAVLGDFKLMHITLAVFVQILVLFPLM